MGAVSQSRSGICSVVVPVRDDASQLRGLLQAPALQARQPLEIIVVDNGSTDGSAEVARAAGCTVVTEATPGIAAAASAGYDSARGELIVRCDADSRPAPGWIAAHESAHERCDPRAVTITGPSVLLLPPPLGAHRGTELFILS
ncbi:glycosyltransferase family A protein [Brachybacterium sp. FME24]|uniref:glycosyltransferase family 2 protein n=1 Tax=Brachybacterium sp. FME24 TaxID=2742605 RepID=UPI00186932D5